MMLKFSKIIVWSGILLILIVGLVHVIDAKDSFEDAIYKGWLFYANGVCGCISRITLIIPRFIRLFDSSSNSG